MRRLRISMPASTTMMAVILSACAQDAPTPVAVDDAAAPVSAAAASIPEAPLPIRAAIQARSEQWRQAFSERRAASVRPYLEQQFGVDAGRLEAAGLGQSRPVDSNDSPEGRQNNRRVELVRL